MSFFDPFADLTRLRSQIERMVDEAGVPARTGEVVRPWRPAVDVLEDPEHLTVRLDLPEIDRESLDVQLNGEELAIRGERSWKPAGNQTVLHQERTHGQFHRTFRVGIPVQGDRVEATYRDGVLTVVLPKAESIKPRRVEVKLAGE